MAPHAQLTNLDAHRTLDDPATDRIVTSRQRRRARNAQSLSALYRERNDIHGVSPVADFVVELTSWCA